MASNCFAPLARSAGLFWCFVNAHVVAVYGDTHTHRHTRTVASGPFSCWAVSLDSHHYLSVQGECAAWLPQVNEPVSLSHSRTQTHDVWVSADFQIIPLMFINLSPLCHCFCYIIKAVWLSPISERPPDLIAALLPRCLSVLAALGWFYSRLHYR